MPSHLVQLPSQPARNGLAIEYIDVGLIRPDPANPRAHSKKQVKQVAASIEAFGFIGALIVDANNVLIAGHARLLAAVKLGFTEVPVIRVRHLTYAQRQAFMLAENQIGLGASWNDRLLAEQLKILSGLDLTFDIEASGFDVGEIDLRIASLDDAADDGGELPLPVVTGPPVSRLGDIWILGRHRLAIGDARDPAAMQALMGTLRASMVFTDPPYNVPIDGHVSGKGQLLHREFPMAIGEMSPEAFAFFLQASLGLAAKHALSGALVYVCMDWRHMEELQAAARDIGLTTLNLCVWTKPNGGMGSLYRSAHELVFVFKKGRGRHRNNVQLGSYGRNRTNVWSYATGPGFGRAGEEGRLSALHPTVKPVQMVVDAILDSTGRGDIVLDPFLGSGTTLMAAERTGRRCCGLELDPLHADTIIRRYEAVTGDAVCHAAGGTSFRDVATVRAAVVKEDAP